jgi:hypothetical protein
MPLITEMIFQGIFDRFPKLRMAAVETGVTWPGPPTSRITATTGRARAA